MVQKIQPWGVIWIQSFVTQAGHLSENKITTYLSCMKIFHAKAHQPKGCMGAGLENLLMVFLRACHWRSYNRFLACRRMNIISLSS